MGAADIVPGVSGGTMALITGIYSELIGSIDNLRLEQLQFLQKREWKAFWKDVNGPFLLPLALGIVSGILFLSGGITYLLEHQPILLWSFFFGLILASIFILFNQLQEKTWLHFLFLAIGFVVAFGITMLSPTAASNNLAYLFFSSMIAIIAMILPGISGAFLFILFGVYEEVLKTVEGALKVWFDFNWESFQHIYSRVLVIALGIVVGLKLFSRILNWLFTNKKEATLSLLIGFMIGALPKIWPWKNFQSIEGEIIAINTSPLNYEGNPQLLIALLIMGLGSFLLIFIEKNSAKK